MRGVTLFRVLINSVMPTARSLKRDFRCSIRLGTGRAYLLAQAYPAVDFSDAIIEASVRNFAYNGQFEAGRKAYLCGLYGLARQQARIRRAVFQALATEQDDTWTLTQLFALALRFAQDGDAKARAALYRRFMVRPINGSRWAGAKEIIALDGLDGLKYIARKVGRWLARHPDGWEDAAHIYTFQELYPGADGWAELRQLATQDEDVHRYLASVEATTASRAEREQQTEVPDADLPGILRMRGRYAIRRRLQKRGLAPQELRQLATQLLAERDAAVRENLYYVFTLFPFPLSYEPLLLQAGQPPNRQNQRLINYALDALALLRAPEIRAFALERLRQSSQPGRYAEILASNYQEGDAALLTAIAERTHSEVAIEQLAISYTGIYEANSTPECAAPLLALYAKMTCAIHRTTVVELLIANNVLPAWLNEELPFDCEEDTRALHQPPV
jgi:hypothetical protein